MLEENQEQVIARLSAELESTERDMRRYQYQNYKLRQKIARIRMAVMLIGIIAITDAVNILAHALNFL